MTMVEAALRYAAMGWYVFPCEPPIIGDDTSGKAPLTRNGKDDATLDPATIALWWQRWPDANIGISVEPSNLIVLDVDTGIDKKTGKPKQGIESLRTIDAELSSTLTAITGSGGYHFVYQRGENPPRQALHVKPGLDILGNGYIIAAPSKHWTGGEYRWQNNAPIAPAPSVLFTLQRAIASNEKIDRTSLPMADQQSRIVAASLIADAWPASGRHFAFLALAGALASEGWTEDAITEFTTMVARLMPNSDDKAIHDRPLQARDSVAKVQAGEAVAGWGTLATFIPEDVIHKSMERLGLHDHSFEWTKEAQAIIDTGFMLPEVKSEKAFTLASELALIDYPPVRSYATGFPDLDKLLGGGFSTQQLIVMLGKPGAGKTAFVIGRALFCENAVPVLYASTELQHNEILARLCSPTLGAPWRDIVRDTACGMDGAKITKEMRIAALEGKRIAVIGQDEIFKAGDKAVELIARTAKAMKDHFGVPPVIVVDYMQELARGEENKQRAKNTAVAVAFRMISQVLDCAVVAVSSVSRAGYGNTGRALRDADDPTVYLALAKESGDIDYAAATIVFVDVDDKRDAEGWRLGRIAVSKSRHGEVGFAGVAFHGATGRWIENTAGVQALSSENQSKARAEDKRDQIESAVMEKLKELHAYGMDHLLTRTELANILGGNAKTTFATINGMVTSGKLIETTIYRTNELQQRKPVHKALAIPHLCRMGATEPPPETAIPSVLEIIGGS